MKNKIFENIVSLLSLQVLNYILPLITLPYLVRVLGTNQFGVLSFATALIQYFVVVTDYGFNLSATRAISLHRDDREKRSLIFCTVLFVKSIIAGITLIVLLIVIAVFTKIRSSALLYLVSWLAVVGNVLFPVWLFQGIERMKYLAIINTAVRIIGTIAIFSFVKNENDIILAALAQNGIVVLAGIVSIALIWHLQLVILIRPDKKTIIETCKEGWPIFLSLLAVSILGNTNIFLLGILMTDYRYAGIYAIAQKIVWAVVNLSTPVANGIFPRVGLLFKQNTENALQFLRKVMNLGAPIFLALSIALFIFANTMVTIVAGHTDALVTNSIRIMAFLPILIFCDNIFGMQIMLNSHLEKQFMFIYMIGSVTLVFTSIVLIPYWNVYGASFSMIISEIIILAMMYVSVRRAGIRLPSLARSL